MHTWVLHVLPLEPADVNACYLSHPISYLYEMPWKRSGLRCSPTCRLGRWCTRYRDHRDGMVEGTRPLCPFLVVCTKQVFEAVSTFGVAGPGLSQDSLDGDIRIHSV